MTDPNGTHLGGEGLARDRGVCLGGGLPERCRRRVAVEERLCRVRVGPAHELGSLRGTRSSLDIRARRPCEAADELELLGALLLIALARVTISEVGVVPGSGGGEWHVSGCGDRARCRREDER